MVMTPWAVRVVGGVMVAAAIGKVLGPAGLVGAIGGIAPESIWPLAVAAVVFVEMAIGLRLISKPMSAAWLIGVACVIVGLTLVLLAQGFRLGFDARCGCGVGDWPVWLAIGRNAAMVSVCWLGVRVCRRATLASGRDATQARE